MLIEFIPNIMYNRLRISIVILSETFLRNRPEKHQKEHYDKMERLQMLHLKFYQGLLIPRNMNRMGYIES